MRFCPHCGAPLMAGAKFCVECGRAVSDGAAPGVAIGSASQQRQKPPKPPSTTGVQLTTAFIVVFLGITIGIVAWLFLGNVVGFDRTPWPLLLTLLNLPQLSIMISLQVSANRSQAASDRRAIADHETLIALHEMAKQQLDILNGQDRVLAILDNFASKDMPGRQRHIQDCVDQILAKVDTQPAAS